MWARILLAWFLFLPVAYVLIVRQGHGAHTALLCMVGYMAVLASTLALRFRSGAWRRIELIEPELA
jgi:MATE family multidrug resistance protein